LHQWEFSQPGQTQTRVAWELRSESLHESFLNSHAQSNANNSSMRVGESWLDITARVAKLAYKTPIRIWTSSKLRVEESAWKSMRVDGQTRAGVATRINSCLTDA
jgi:hypothetical protein